MKKVIAYLGLQFSFGFIIALMGMSCLHGADKEITFGEFIGIGFMFSVLFAVLHLFLVFIGWCVETLDN